MNHLSVEPEVVIDSDYDGYFENLVRVMIKIKKGQFKHKGIVVSSGPWRNYAVTHYSEGDTIVLDFYSALRVGFGYLSHTDLEQLAEEL